MFEIAPLYYYWPQRLIKADLFILNYILFYEPVITCYDCVSMRSASGVILHVYGAFENSALIFCITQHLRLLAT